MIPMGIKILSKITIKFPTKGNQKGAVIKRNTIAANSKRKTHLYFYS